MSVSLSPGGRQVRHQSSPSRGRRRPVDLVCELGRAHRRFDHRCRELLAEPWRDRRRGLERFAAELLAHEALEQLLVHPVVAAQVPGGGDLVAARVREERWLEEQLTRLLAAPVGAVGVREELRGFHQHLIEHTDREEIETLPRLWHVLDAHDLEHRGALYVHVHRELVTTGTAAAIVLAAARPVADDPVVVGDPRGPLLRLRDAAAAILRADGFAVDDHLGTGDDGVFAVLDGAPPPVGAHEPSSPGGRFLLLR